MLPCWQTLREITMELRQLRHLVTVARFASFGLAAEHLNLTQPALSKSIRALELSKGVRLLERGPSGVRPTVFGERLIEYGKLVLALTAEAEGEIDAMRGVRRGTLHVGAPASALRGVVAQTVKRFAENHPDIDIRINEALNEALYSDLLNGAIDLAIMSRPGEINTDEIELRALLDVPILIVADKDHELVGKREVTLAELVPCLWVIPPRPEPDRLKLDTLFLDAALPRPKAVIETTSGLFQTSVMIGTDWLSYLPRSNLDEQGQLSRLVPLKLRERTWARTICAVFRRRGIVRPTVLAFLHELEKTCMELKGDFSTVD
jgi:DNA-binding transcriptional LysR family regulator